MFASPMLAIALSASPTARQEAGLPAAEVKASDPLTLTLEIASSVVSRGSRRVFRFKLANSSSTPVWVPNNLDRGVVIVLKDEKGRELHPSMVGKLCPVPPPPENDPERGLRILEPGACIQGVEEWSLRDLGVRKRGRYTATALWFLAVSMGEKHRFEHLRETPVESNSVVFRVR